MNSKGPTMLLLEKYLLDELCAEEKQALQKQIAKDEELKTKIETLMDENAYFKEKYPWNKHEIGKKLNEHPLNTTNWKPQFSTAFAGIAVVLGISLLLPQIDTRNNHSSIETLEVTRIKGLHPQLRIYRKNNLGFELLKDNAQVSAHDTLQLSYISASAKHGLIFSLDGNAQVTLHYPSVKSDSTQLNKQGETRLSFSYELDDAPDFERFFFITSDKPINVSSLLNSAHHLA